MAMIEAEEVVRRAEMIGKIQPTLEATDRAIQRVRLALTERPVARPVILWTRGVTTMRRHVKLAAMIVILLGAGILAVHTILRNEATVAFADVGARVQQARTMTWKCEMTFPLEGTTRIVRYSVKKPGLTRSVSSDKTIIVRDHRKGVQMSLVPAKKTALFIDISQWPEHLRSQLRDEAWELRAIFQQPGKPLGDKRIDGRKVRGFRVTHNGQLYEVWVDSTTAEPIRMETWIPSGFSQVMTEFVLDPKLDDSLFRVTPPDGYTPQKIAVGIAAGHSEKAVIRGLRFLAKHNDKVFPPQAALTPKIVKSLKDEARQQAHLPKKEREERIRASNHAFMGMVGFVYYNPDLAEWSYVGKGVKLGDRKTPVCWYRARNATSYRVLYGDLSVREIRKDELERLAKLIREARTKGK